MPARSAKIIKSSFVVSKAKAEQFLANNSQKFDQLFDEFLVGVDSQTRRKCHETIHFTTLTAAIVGFSPIPFSDAVLLVPIQLTMMMRLYKIFGASWSEALAKGVTKELVVVGLGRSLVGNVLRPARLLLNHLQNNYPRKNLCPPLLQIQAPMPRILSAC